ncbi:MAG: AAA family ATPase [Rhodoferax sp.]|nr:AAA family ATPase [Actinomycetota bacterium]
MLVNGLPGAGKSTLARAVAAELSLPLLSKDVVKEQIGEHLPDDVATAHNGPTSPLGAGATGALWSLLADVPTGAVLESWWPADVGPLVEAGLRRAGVDPAAVVEIWCDVPAALARERYGARARHRIHGPQVGLAWWNGPGPAAATPLGLGPVLRVDTSSPLTTRAVVDVSLRARALAI